MEVPDFLGHSEKPTLKTAHQHLFQLLFHQHLFFFNFSVIKPTRFFFIIAFVLQKKIAISYKALMLLFPMDHHFSLVSKSSSTNKTLDFLFTIVINFWNMSMFCLHNFCNNPLCLNALFSYEPLDWSLIRKFSHNFGI